MKRRVANDIKEPKDLDHVRMDGTRCLVLGGGGFLGLATVRRLVESGAFVTAFGRGAAPVELHGLATWTRGDFRDAAALKSALTGQDFVFHLVGTAEPQIANRDPRHDVEGNILPTLQLLDLLTQEKRARVIFASSGGTVYGLPERVPIRETARTDPITAYGVSKLAIEKYLELYRHLHGLEYRVLRIANAYGPGQSPVRSQGVVAAMINQAIAGKVIEIWGDGSVVRDFIHVDDIAAAFVKAASHDGPSRIFNVGSGVGRSISTLYRDVAATTRAYTLPPRYMAAQPADVGVNVLDSTLFMSETDWRPGITWEAGLKETAAWLTARTAGAAE